MATTLEQKIDELLGKLEMSGAGGGVMNLLNTPANLLQDAQREKYLMDMTTSEGFLEPTDTTRGFDTPAERAASLYDANMPGTMMFQDNFIPKSSDDRVYYQETDTGLGDMNSFTSSNLGFSDVRGFDTPAMRDNAQAVLSRLSEAELRDVMEILPQLNGQQYQAFIAGLEDGSINPSGYEVQNQPRLRM